MVAWARVIVVKGEVNYGKGIITCSTFAERVLIEGLICLESELRASKQAIVSVLPKKRD